VRLRTDRVAGCAPLIKVLCFDSLEAVAHLRGDINALNRASARPDPFSTFEFYENYFAHDENYPDRADSRVWFLVAFTGGRLIGYLPLRMTVRRVLGMRHSTLEFLVKHDTDRPHLVAREELASEVGAAMYAYLRTRRREWSFLECQQQDGSSQFPPPESAGTKGYLLAQWPSLEHCSIPVKWNTLEEYVGAMSRKFRANLSRQMRHLVQAGDLQLLWSSDPGTTPLLLSLYQGIEARSWKARARAGISRNACRIAYFNGLLTAAQPMKIDVKVLLLDGIPVAGIICGTFMQRMYALQMVYDERYGRLAPGSALLLLAMRQAIEGRYACLNLLSGFGYYKSRWLADCTQTHIAQIYRTGSVLWFRRAAGDLKRRIFREQVEPKQEMFNASRREVSEGAVAPGDLSVPTHPAACAEEQLKHAAVIAAIRSGQGEFLTTPELAAVMSFDRSGRSGKRSADNSTMPVTLISSPARIPASAPTIPKLCMPQ
jgi:hypothetical protein